MSGGLYFSRTRRIERQAYKWVMRMIDDPQRHTVNVQRWIARSPDHQAAYKRIVTEVGYASDAATLMPSLRPAQRSAPNSRGWKRQGYLAATVALAGCLLFAIGWRFSTPGTETLPNGHDQVQTASIADGEKRLTLADGSTVLMRGATTLRVRFGVTERAVELLSGLARFDVKHNRTRPFVVYAKGGSVTAVGTVFEVSVKRDVEVRLIEGRVTVAMPRKIHEVKGQEVILVPGDKMSFSPAPQREPTSPPTSGETQAPALKLNMFDDVPAYVIVAEVNKRSATKIEIVDAAVGQQKIFAELNLNDADAVARKIAASLGLTIDRTVSGRIRLSRGR